MMLTFYQFHRFEFSPIGIREKHINGFTKLCLPLQFLPSGTAIITGSDDCTCKMYDLRADQEVICYQDAALNSGVTSLALSMSGRLIFAGYDDFNCNIWDSLKGEKVGKFKERRNGWSE